MYFQYLLAILCGPFELEDHRRDSSVYRNQFEWRKIKNVQVGVWGGMLEASSMACEEEWKHIGKFDI